MVIRPGLVRAQEITATCRFTTDEGAAVQGEFGALIMAASSRVRTVGAHQGLGWHPEHTNMLTTVGEARLRTFAARPASST